ncbi:hypothetical protein [Paenibacillus sacheonensis]|uniref:Uncharacterized protein n=1 Tax=Paenibacillus sacheonensis TaxID=742054 RepID=A0A7X4YKW3_9BACL|nr:hypothetical protein [Paenibacillus sacheonensis]MBM7563182.1 ssRNA-specific RNase YbeY (16S rRNA maturation enzyme) [Paenibacillus sacheonensis]NBC68255.1 hypothetical protein [Paenibacillus sacheonensis]
MKLAYRFDERRIEILESANGTDAEFEINLRDLDLEDGLREVKKRFDENDSYTDVLFYAYENHRFKVIVRSEYYVDFIMALMGNGLLRQVEWTE